MGLDVALNTSVSGIKANQTALEILANNIANANVEGYNRRVVVQSANVLGTTPAGTFVEQAQRQVDAFVVEQARRQLSDLGFYDAQKAYLDRVAAFYGQPDSGTSVSSFLDNFYNAFNDVAGTPEQAFFRTLAVQRGDELAGRISGLTEDIQSARFEIDQEIDRLVADVDSLFFSLSTVHQGLNNAPAGSSDEAELLDERDRILDEISEIIDITVTFDAQGAATVFTNEVVFISPGGNRAQLTYQPSISVESVIGDTPFQAITAQTIDLEGDPVGTPVDLATLGTSDTVTTVLTSGSLASLLDLRDNVLPDLVEQLDELAFNLIEETNVLHNQGTGYPPPTSLTGTTEVTLNDERAFTGSVQIAVLQEDGLPVASPYGNEDFLKPLTIDFDNLEGDTTTNGEVTIQRIIDEIDEYYGVQRDRVNIGPLQNIELVPTNDPTAGATLDFNMFIDSIQVDDVTVSDATIAIAGGPAAITVTPAIIAAPTGGTEYTTGITIEPGSQIRTVSGGNSPFTDGDLSLDFTGEAAGTYTIDVPVSVTDGLGNTLTSTITYSVDFDGVNFTNISQNSRIPPTAATGDGTIDNVAGLPIAVAELVDANGTVVTDPNTAGFLQIRAADGTTNRVAIREIDSVEGGLLDATDSVTTGTATGRGFSHFFGMNNYFVEPASQSGSALNMAVTQALIDDPSGFSAGQLVQAAQDADAVTTGLGNYTFSLGVGDNQNAELLTDMRTSVIQFDAAGGLSSLSTNIENYAGQLTSFVSLLVNTSDDNLAREQVLANVFSSQLDGIGGVNIDEELANTIFFENNYAGNAQMINTVKELFELLFQAVRG